MYNLYQLNMQIYVIIYFPGELIITTNSSEVGGYFQVQFILTMKWFESRLKFKNLKNDINLNGFLPNEIGDIWVPEMIFSNTEEKPSTIVDEKTTIFVEKIGEHKLSASDENENIQYFALKSLQFRLRRDYEKTCNWYSVSTSVMPTSNNWHFGCFHLLDPLYSINILQNPIV